MSFIEKNLEAIKHRDVVLYDQLQLDRLIDRVMSAPSKDGNSYLKVLQQGKWVAFNSTYKPLDEAAKFAGKYKELPLFGRVLFLGFGNGYIARALQNQYRDEACLDSDVINAERKFAFYEPDASVFLYVMQTYDLSDVLGNENISIFVEGLNGNLLPAWCSQNVGNHNEGSFYLDALPKYKEYYQDAYERLQKVYQDTMMGLSAYRETKIELAKRIARNNIFNLKYYQHAMSLQWFMNCYPKDLPFVIVSAGPSLKERIELLRQLQGKAFIMAVDTAVKYLLEQRICPDGILCIDCRKDLFLFQKAMWDIPFFVHTDVNHQVLDKVIPEFTYFISSNMKYYESLGCDRGDELLDIETGGSVATMAFSLATALSVTDVVLVGQDLAVQRDSSHILSQMKRDMETEQILYVPGNEEEQVTTLVDFYLYLQWFQKEIAKHADIHVWNATAGGARIAGATYVSPERLQEQLGDHTNLYQEFSCQWETQKLLARNHKIELLKQGDMDKNKHYENIIVALQGLKDKLYRGSVICEKLCHLCKNNAMEMIEFHELNKELNEIEQQLTAIPEFEWLEIYCADMEDLLIHNLYETQGDKAKEMESLYEKLKVYYEMLAKRSDEVVGLCQEAM